MFPGEAFAPKVQLEREAAPRQLSRAVETERRRRLYGCLNLRELLRERGIDAADVAREDKYLPLEIFDDEEYDCRYIYDVLINKSILL